MISATNYHEVKVNLLSGLTVSLAMVPEAIAFALIAQVSPLTGLYAAIIICFITAVFGGRPGMVSGATGALAVVMVSLVAGVPAKIIGDHHDQVPAHDMDQNLGIDVKTL